MLNVLAGAGHRALDPFAIERLQKIVERVYVECLQSVLVVCSNKNDRRKPLGIERFDHLETVLFRHLYVQKNEVRILSVDRVDGLETVAALTDDADAVFFSEEPFDPVPGEWFVVYDEGFNGHLNFR